MRARFLLLCAAALSAATAACLTQESNQEQSTTSEAAFAVSQCTAGERPSSGYSVVPALNDKQFQMPVAMVPKPGTNNQFYVVEKKGFVRLVTTGDPTAQVATFADITARVNAGPNEAGLLGFALHPKFSQNGLVYFSYTKPSPTSSANLASVIVRGKTINNGTQVDMSSLTELLSFDDIYSNHNGGSINFGPDGFLYASFGDGGSGGDPQGMGQNKNTWFGKILRIDVDSGSLYGIPSDNPFAAGGGKPEIFAYGLRNVWRFSFDRLTGDLWAGDVGQNKWEEIDKVVLGGNYGWNKREGKHCYGTTTNCDIPGAIDPIVEYDHSQGYSVTGGYVYRGSEMPQLQGHYLYGDFGSGKIWSIPTNNPNPTAQVVLASSLSIASFAEDNAGELYVLDYGSGKIKKIVSTPSSDGVPAKLSETGCFKQADPKTPVDKLVAYDVNSPLWSDGADKARWFSLPANGKIKVLADGRFDFPIGTVLVKEFKLHGKRVETRLFVRHTDGSWAGYTYEWNDAETDALLLPDGKSKFIAAPHDSAASADAGADAPPGQTWSYPSRAQCMACHNASVGGAIGLESAQLNRDFTYADGTTTNQLAKLDSLGLFAAPAAAKPALPSPANADLDLESRARSYLHANCAFCHRPQGPGRGAADFRFSRTFAQTKVCNAEAESGTLGIADAKLLVPGNAASSLISVRMHALDTSRMPAVGSSIVDPLGTDIVDAWINSVASCPGY